MTQAKPRPDLESLLADTAAVTRAVQKAGRDAILRHKRLGEPIVVWRDVQVVEIAPEDIPEDGVFPPGS